MKSFFQKNNSNNSVEYIETDAPFAVIDFSGKRHEGFTWGRLSMPSKNINDHTYFIEGLFLFMSINLTGPDEKTTLLPIDKSEYQRLRKLAKRNKKITFSNPTVINLAICGLLVAIIGLFLNVLINLDKIEANCKKIQKESMVK